MIRLPRVAAVIVTLAAATLATTAQGGGAHAATAPTVTPPRTHLVLHVTGCDGCFIAAQQAVNGRLHVWTSPTKHVGSDHRVTYDLRTARTQGMSFLVEAPWEGNTGAISNMVTRYAGHGVDSLVSRAAARDGRQAEGCWSGTTLDAARLDFHVARVPGKTLDGRPTHLPLAYATHTISSWKPMVSTFKGTIGNQDAFWCTRP